MSYSGFLEVIAYVGAVALIIHGINQSLLTKYLLKNNPKLFSSLQSNALASWAPKGISYDRVKLNFFAFTKNPQDKPELARYKQIYLWTAATVVTVLCLAIVAIWLILFS